MSGIIRTSDNISKVKRFKKLTQDQSLFIKDNYSEKGSKYCSDALGISRERIVKHAAHIKVQLRPELRRQWKSEDLKSLNRSYGIDINQFLKIEKAEVAYFLGFLWADGYVKIFPRRSGGNYVIRLMFAKEDYLILKDTFQKLGNYNVYPIKKQKESWKDAVVIVIGNKILAEFLSGLDYEIKSTASPTKILSKIPEHLKHYFWRGYFDGDGYFSKAENEWYRFSITSGYEQDWLEQELILKSLNIKYVLRKEIFKNNKFSNILCQNLEGCSKWGDYIYKNYDIDNIGLKRKYLRWANIKKYYVEYKNRI